MTHEGTPANEAPSPRYHLSEALERSSDFKENIKPKKEELEKEVEKVNSLIRFVETFKKKKYTDDIVERSKLILGYEKELSDAGTPDWRRKDVDMNMAIDKKIVEELTRKLDGAIIKLDKLNEEKNALIAKIEEIQSKNSNIAATEKTAGEIWDEKKYHDYGYNENTKPEDQ